MLKVAPEKSTITFTPDKAAHPQVLISGQAIPLDKTPRILGVHFETHFSFGTHALNVVMSCRNKLYPAHAGWLWLGLSEGDYEDV